MFERLSGRFSRCEIDKTSPKGGCQTWWQARQMSPNYSGHPAWVDAMKTPVPPSVLLCAFLVLRNKTSTSLSRFCTAAPYDQVTSGANRVWIPWANIHTQDETCDAQTNSQMTLFDVVIMEATVSGDACNSVLQGRNECSCRVSCMC